MAKIALVNDTHFGCRNDNPNYHEYIYKFWQDQFFPYLEEHNIKHIIHLGDVLDRISEIMTVVDSAIASVKDTNVANNQSYVQDACRV